MKHGKNAIWFDVMGNEDHESCWSDENFKWNIWTVLMRTTKLTRKELSNRNHDENGDMENLKWICKIFTEGGSDVKVHFDLNMSREFMSCNFMYCVLFMLVISCIACCLWTVIICWVTCTSLCLVMRVKVVCVTLG